MLERDEGRVAKVYPDPLTGGAPWTVGIGHTGPDVHQGDVWTDEQIDEAFDRDVATAETGCMDNLPWFNQLDEVRRAVLIAMCFQMGINRMLGFDNMLKLCGEGNYSAAAQHMRNSLWARQTPKRAIRMADQLETGRWT